VNKSDLQLLYSYNRWANARILTAAKQTTPEQFLAGANFPHGGLRSTLTHLLSAEWIWRSRWQGSSPRQVLQPAEFPTLQVLSERWQREAQLLSAFLKNVPDEQLEQDFEYMTTDGRPMRNVLWQAMVHVVNHGTQHRSEAAAMLTDFGCSPGNIDLIVFLREG